MIFEEFEPNYRELYRKFDDAIQCVYCFYSRNLKQICKVHHYYLALLFGLRLYVMGFVLMVFLIVHLKKKPYKDPVMNWLESSLLALLLILNALSIFNILEFYHIPEASNFVVARFFRSVKVIILLLPVPLFVVMKLIYRYHETIEQTINVKLVKSK